MINHALNQFVSYCSAFPDVWGCIQMCLDGSEHQNTPNLLDFWASANLGVYKLTGAILIGGVRWHQTFPRGGARRSVDLSWFLNPTGCLWDLLPSISGVSCGAFGLSWLIWVGSRILPVPCGSGLRVGWFELSQFRPVACGTSYRHSVVCCSWLSCVPLLVLCFVPNVSLLRCSSSAHGWDKHGYNGSFFGSCQGVSLWSLKLSGYCATAW